MPSTASGDSYALVAVVHRRSARGVGTLPSCGAGAAGRRVAGDGARSRPIERWPTSVHFVPDVPTGDVPFAGGEDEQLDRVRRRQPSRPPAARGARPQRRRGVRGALARRCDGVGWPLAAVGVDGLLGPGSMSTDPAAYAPAVVSHLVVRRTGLEPGKMPARSASTSTTSPPSSGPTPTAEGSPICPTRSKPPSSASSSRSTAPHRSRRGRRGCPRRRSSRRPEPSGPGRPPHRCSSTSGGRDVKSAPYRLDLTYQGVGSGQALASFADGVRRLRRERDAVRARRPHGNRPPASFGTCRSSATPLAFMVNLTGLDGNRITTLRLDAPTACRAFTERGRHRCGTALGRPGNRRAQPPAWPSRPKDVARGRALRRQRGRATPSRRWCIAEAPEVWDAFRAVAQPGDDPRAGRRAPGDAVAVPPRVSGRRPQSTGIANTVTRDAGLDHLHRGRLRRDHRSAAGRTAQRGRFVHCTHRCGGHRGAGGGGHRARWPRRPRRRPGGPHRLPAHHGVVPAAAHGPHERPRAARAVSEYVYYGMTRGQDQAAPLQYAPLPDAWRAYAHRGGGWRARRNALRPVGGLGRARTAAGRAGAPGAGAGPRSRPRSCSGGPAVAGSPSGLPRGSNAGVRWGGPHHGGAQWPGRTSSREPARPSGR